MTEAVLHGATWGVLLPPLYFVNGLDRPFFTGVLMSGWPAGRLAARLYCRWAGGTAQRGRIGTIFAYASLAVGAGFHVSGFAALLIATSVLFAVGAFNANQTLLDGAGRLRAVHSWGVADFWMNGVAAGAMISAKLTWSLQHGHRSIDLSLMLWPAIVATLLSAFILLTSTADPSSTAAADPSPGHGHGSHSAGPPTKGRRANLMFLGFLSAVSVSRAVLLLLTPLLAEESFAANSGIVALLLACSMLVAWLTRRLLIRAFSSGRIQPSWMSITVGNLCVWIGGTALLMWAPVTLRLPLLYLGILSVAVAGGALQLCLQLLLGHAEGFSPDLIAADSLLRPFAMTVGVLCSASLYYRHERTSFGVSALAAIAALIWLSFARALLPQPMTRVRGKKS